MYLDLTKLITVANFLFLYLVSFKLVFVMVFFLFVLDWVENACVIVYLTRSYVSFKISLILSEDDEWPKYYNLWQLAYSILSFSHENLDPEHRFSVYNFILKGPSIALRLVKDYIVANGADKIGIEDSLNPWRNARTL